MSVGSRRRPASLRLSTSCKQQRPARCKRFRRPPSRVRAPRSCEGSRCPVFWFAPAGQQCPGRRSSDPSTHNGRCCPACWRRQHEYNPVWVIERRANVIRRVGLRCKHHDLALGLGGCSQVKRMLRFGACGWRAAPVRTQHRKSARHDSVTRQLHAWSPDVRAAAPLRLLTSWQLQDTNPVNTWVGVAQHQHAKSAHRGCSAASNSLTIDHDRQVH